MVTQAPKRTAVLTALAFALSCIVLIIFVWLQFHGTVPLAPRGYQVRAVFNETGLLVPQADVRISGVNVGRVSTVQDEGESSLVTMEINGPFAPIPADTRAILRQKTLLGEAYVELSTGNGHGRKLTDGGTLPATHVEQTQQLDQVLATFNRPTQQALQELLSGTYHALAGRGQELNDALGNLDPTMTELNALVGALNDQSGDVRRLVSGSAQVLGTLGDRGGDLQTLLTAGDQVLSTTASRNAALSATVRVLPPFLTALRTTLGSLNTTLGIARPSLDDLRTVAPLLTPALSDLITLSGPAVRLLRQTPSLLAAAERALPAINRFTAAFHPAVDAILPASLELAPVISYVGLYSKELVAAMGNLAADLQATAPANTPSGSTNYLRAISAITNESIYGQSIREPTVRTNPYFSPGELANIAGGLLAASCANTSNPAQVPGGQNVPCRLQPPYPWGHGWATAYFPHVMRAKVPSR